MLCKYISTSSMTKKDRLRDSQALYSLTFAHAADDEEDEDTADAGVTDPTTRLFQMVKDRDYDDEEEEIVDDEDDGLMPLSEEPDEMKRVSTF